MGSMGVYRTTLGLIFRISETPEGGLKVEVLKDSTVVHTFEPGKNEFEGKWTDPKPTAGTHYYYVRVQQDDGELAWGSPMWIDLAR